MDYFDNSVLLTTISTVAQPQRTGNNNNGKYFVFGFIVAAVVAIIVYKFKSPRKKDKNGDIPTIHETDPPSASSTPPASDF